MLSQFREEIAEYERLVNHSPELPLVFKTRSIRLDDLAAVLIQARIAAKISHKELAALTGVREETIKDYEAKNYQNASFLEVIEVGEALGI